MSLKLRKTIQSGHFTAKVFADKDWNEYRVKFYKDDKHLGEECDAFADDEKEAISTAEAELQFMSNKETVNA